MPANGTIIQVIGSTFDAQFPEDQLPAIYNAVKCSVTVSLQSEWADALSDAIGALLPPDA